VQGAVKKTSQERDIKDVLEGGEVTIPLDGMHEPRFRREGGTRDMVLPGNKKFIEGDYLQRSGQGSAKDSGPGEGDGEDAFRFVLSRDEFVDLFLDDLELPDLAKRKVAQTESDGIQRAGYTTSGSPSNISVGRTVRRALARRIALKRPSKDEIEELEAAIAACADEDERLVLLAQLEKMKAKTKRIPFIDPLDIRYRRFETVPKPVAQAVMFCLMDVSGSMSEHMKDLAKRFYMLLYIFLTRQYKRVEIVFIRHTDTAEEVDEETFFRSPATGGTQVSSALAEMRKIMLERFPPADWNIYAAQASDGDNAYSDNAAAAALMQEWILPATQYFAYLEVGEGRSMAISSGSAVWQLYERISAGWPVLSMRKVSDRSQIYPVFHDLFQRRTAEGKVG
jgi:uncharacterized sporulation protein YeaH/YhbH (DUF444 family)